MSDDERQTLIDNNSSPSGELKSDGDIVNASICPYVRKTISS